MTLTCVSDTESGAEALTHARRKPFPLLAVATEAPEKIGILTVATG